MLINKKLEHIESDINSIRALVKGNSFGKIVSLKGLLKGVKITDANIEEAKKSPF